MSLCLSVSLSLCPLTYLKNHMSELHKIFLRCYSEPWLGSPLTTIRYVFPVLWTMSYDTIRYDTLYLCALKSWQIANLVCRKAPKNKKSNEETKSKKTKMLRRNGPVTKSVEPVPRQSFHARRVVLAISDAGTVPKKVVKISNVFARGRHAVWLCLRTQWQQAADRSWSVMSTIALFRMQMNAGIHTHEDTTT